MDLMERHLILALLLAGILLVGSGHAAYMNSTDYAADSIFTSSGGLIDIQSNDYRMDNAVGIITSYSSSTDYSTWLGLYGAPIPSASNVTLNASIQVLINSSGTGFVTYNQSNNITMLCNEINVLPTWCPAQYQNNLTGVYIFRVINNGTAASSWRAMSINQSVNGSIWCGLSSDPTGGTNINLTTALKNYTTTSLAAGAFEGVYCQYNISGLAGNHQFTLNFTEG